MAVHHPHEAHLPHRLPGSGVPQQGLGDECGAEGGGEGGEPGGCYGTHTGGAEEGEEGVPHESVPHTGMVGGWDGGDEGDGGDGVWGSEFSQASLTCLLLFGWMGVKQGAGIH